MLGTRIGRYEIRAPAGTGGMGEVYLAHDTQLQRAVVLMPFGGGGIVKTFDLPPGVNLDTCPLWGPNGRTLTFSNTSDGISRI